MKVHLIKHARLFSLCLVIVCSCSKKEPKEDVKRTQDPVLVLPGEFMLVLPVNAETCSNFVEVSGEADMAEIHLSWTTAENTNSYTIQVFDSETQVSNTTITQTELELKLEKGKSYSWYITATNNDGETTSDTFSFTTPGVAVANFVPYAAEISTTYDSSVSLVSVNWSGSDEDGDHLTYIIEVVDPEGSNVIVYELNVGSAYFFAHLLGKYTIRVTSTDIHGSYSISTKTIEIIN